MSTAGRRFSDAREDPDDILHALHGTEVRDVHQHVRIRRDTALERRRVLRAIVDVGIDEVRNDLDSARRTAEGRQRLALKVARHCGEPVRLFDRELRDRAERRILADDRDVRAVQRRHDAHVGARLVQHLLGDPGARRVRDRVVAMQQVEPVREHDFVHANREREVVRRKLEQRIAPDVDFVEVDPRQE